MTGSQLHHGAVFGRLLEEWARVSGSQVVSGCARVSLRHSPWLRRGSISWPRDSDSVKEDLAAGLESRLRGVGDSSGIWVKEKLAVTRQSAKMHNP